VAFGHLPNKKPETSARAWIEAALANPRVGKLHVVGIPSAREQDRIQALDPGKTIVEVLPFLRDEEFESIRDGAGIVLMPSTTEGFGLPIIEGFVRHQVPVISSDPALVEVAAGRGVVVNGSSPAAFAQGIHEAIRRIDSDKDHIRKVAASAREQSWDRTWQLIQTLMRGADPWECPHCRTGGLGRSNGETDDGPRGASQTP
jgi:glycosyltransferase involved in cell wall biosynthesis